MAGIVLPCVSVSGYAAVRYSLGSFGLLRPRGLPSVLVFITIVWPLCPGRSAMRGCVDVDVRHDRLLDCRGSFRSTFTLPTSAGRSLEFAIRVGTRHGADGSATDGGCLNVRPVHSYPATHLFQSARRGLLGIHALRLLGTH